MGASAPVLVKWLKKFNTNMHAFKRVWTSSKRKEIVANDAEKMNCRRTSKF